MTALERLVELSRQIELPELFDVSVEAKQGTPTDARAVGAWLDNNLDQKFFARPVRQTEIYKKKVLKNQSWSALARALTSIGADSDEYTHIDAQRVIISGYEVTTSTDYDRITIRLNSKKKSVAPEECYICPIISRTEIRIFWSYRHFEYTDWDATAPTKLSPWQSEGIPIKGGDLSGLVTTIISAFSEFVTKGLQEVWPEPSGELTGGDDKGIEPAKQ